MVRGTSGVGGGEGPRSPCQACRGHAFVAALEEAEDAALEDGRKGAGVGGGEVGRLVEADPAVDLVAHLPCVADRYVGAAPEAVVAEGSVLTPVDIRPSVLNRREVQAALWYECAEVRWRGIGGTVTVRLSLDRTGAVTEAVVSESGGHQALDRAVMEAVDTMRFSPVVHEGREVPAQVILHIHAGARR